MYGTLRRGQGNSFARRLEESGSWVGGARMSGRLYHLNHYPGMVESSIDSDWVHGDVYELPDDPSFLSFLDDYEGHEFARRKGQVIRPDGERCEAWYYAYTGPLTSATPIIEGDYVTWVARTGRISAWPSMQPRP